jgi:O-antigen/teichoic acid export membrane protein
VSAESHRVAAARGGGAVFAGRLFAWGSRFLLAVILARSLGDVDYGRYSLALAVATVVASFAILGLDSAIVRFGAIFRGRGDTDGLAGAIRFAVGVPIAISFGLGIGMLLLSETIAFDWIGQPSVAPLLRVTSVLVPALVVNQLIASTLQGLGRVEYGTLAEQFLQPIVRFAVIGVVIVIGLTAELAVVASTVAALAATALLLVFLRRTAPGALRARGTRAEPGRMLRYSLPVYFSNVVTTLGGNLQMLLLGAMSTIASVGVFSVASNVNLIGTIFQAAVVGSSMPLYARLHDQGDRAAVRDLYAATSRWTFTLNLPFFLAMLLAPTAILGIFGREFESGGAALVILAGANLINAGTGTSGAVLDMTGFSWVKLINASLSVGLALVLNLLLIPQFGLIGAAWALFASLSTVNLLRLVEVKLLIGLSPYDRSWWKPIAAGVVAGGIGLITLELLGPAGLLGAALGLLALGASYIGALVAFGLDEQDHAILRRIGGKLRRGRGAKRDGRPADAGSTSGSA